MVSELRVFILAMVETAIRITNGQIKPNEILQIIDTGKSLLTMPIELLDEVENVLKQLKGKYKLILATKGDLLDQETETSKIGADWLLPSHRDHERQARG